MLEDQLENSICHLTISGNMPGKCLGSRCMAWRKIDSKYKDRGHYYSLDMTGTGEWIQDGVCGLIPVVEVKL
jgi:hypothetical protein